MDRTFLFSLPPPPPPAPKERRSDSVNRVCAFKSSRTFKYMFCCESSNVKSSYLPDSQRDIPNRRLIYLISRTECCVYVVCDTNKPKMKLKGITWMQWCVSEWVSVMADVFAVDEDYSTIFFWRVLVRMQQSLCELMNINLWLEAEYKLFWLCNSDEWGGGWVPGYSWKTVLRCDGTKLMVGNLFEKYVFLVFSLSRLLSTHTHTLRDRLTCMWNWRWKVSNVANNKCRNH